MRQKVLEGLKDALEGEEVLPIAARIVAQFTFRSRQTILSSYPACRERHWAFCSVFPTSDRTKPRSRREQVIA
jgi:hypothetical protein